MDNRLRGESPSLCRFRSYGSANGGSPSDSEFENVKKDARLGIGDEVDLVEHHNELVHQDLAHDLPIIFVLANDISAIMTGNR